jgi:hypothetical protein
MREERFDRLARRAHDDRASNPAEQPVVQLRKRKPRNGLTLRSGRKA